MTLQDQLRILTGIERAETFKMNYVDQGDLEKAQYVSKVLDTFNMEPVLIKERVSAKSALSDAVSLMGVLGVDVAKKAESLLNSTDILSVHPLPFIYSCNIQYKTDASGCVDENSGKIYDLKVPHLLDTSASVFLGHETLHLMKETNYKEYVDAYVLSDVIPLFYELLMMEKIEESKVLFAERMHLLLAEKVNFDEFTRRIGYNDWDVELYKYSQTRAGEYLNSFYYAVILYNMYKNDPKGILSLVQKVLNHEMTTREMLTFLDIYQKDNNDIFDLEFNNVRSM